MGLPGALRAVTSLRRGGRRLSSQGPFPSQSCPGRPDQWSSSSSHWKPRPAGNLKPEHCSGFKFLLGFQVLRPLRRHSGRLSAACTNLNCLRPPECRLYHCLTSLSAAMCRLSRYQLESRGLWLAVTVGLGAIVEFVPAPGLRVTEAGSPTGPPSGWSTRRDGQQGRHARPLMSARPAWQACRPRNPSQVLDGLVW